MENTLVIHKPTLVLGASLKPERMSWTVTNRLQNEGHPVYAIGGRAGTVGNTTVYKTWEEAEAQWQHEQEHGIHTVTFYLNASRQKPYYEKILNLKPQRLIFNPGAENPELCDLAQAAGIHCEFACTMVMMSLQHF